MIYFIKSTDEVSIYVIKNTCLEFDMVSDPEIIRLKFVLNSLKNINYCLKQF